MLIDRRVADVQAALTEYGAAWPDSSSATTARRCAPGFPCSTWLPSLNRRWPRAESLRGFVRSGRWWARPTDHGVDGAISTLRGAYAPAV